MGKRPAMMLVSLFRACRLVPHLFYGCVLAALFPYFSQSTQRYIVKSWSRQLLDMLNIGIQVKGQPPTRGEAGCLIVANHVSWLDILVLNAIHPSFFIAKSEIRGWPLIGWLSRRIGTLFIERAMRNDANSINRQAGTLLRQGGGIGLFPEGTTTDGRQVGHFHSALFQSAIDAETRLCPTALRYQDEGGELSTAAVFTGDTTLVRSIWDILRCSRFDALVIFTPPVHAAGQNRRILARAAQEAIAQALHIADASSRMVTPREAHPHPQTMISPQSAYALLIDPMIGQVHE